jgi:hypothetical protein
MNIRHLLQQRANLLRQARLANLAYAHERLGTFGARIARARLQGEVILRPAEPSADRLWPELTSDEINPAVLAEHFLDEDLAELADVLAFIHDDERPACFVFRLEDLEKLFRPTLRRELSAAGVVVTDGSQPDAAPTDSREVNSARDEAE